jgi:hypothetical protein
MANRKYAHVVDLLATGRLQWERDAISGILTTGAAFTTEHERFSDLGTTRVAETLIMGKVYLTGGLLLGYPAFFNTVKGDVDYQMILVNDPGDHDPYVLAFYDTNAQSGPLRLDNTGTLVVRPEETPDPFPEDLDTSARIWMRV